MRKFLNLKFWSQGTPLGYRKARLAQGIPKIFSHVLFLAHLMVTKLPQIPVSMENLIFTGDHSSHLWRHSMVNIRSEAKGVTAK